MKHLLIILISTLLLSSFLTSCDKNKETLVIRDNQKGDTLYRWGEYPEIVWKGFGEKKTHPVYNGDVKNGVPNGLGLMIFPNGHKYEGEWRDGLKNGQGTLTFPDGTKYVGGYKDDKRNGQGTYTWSDGKYVGKWEDGDSNGQGTKTWSSGNKYVGEWKKGYPWNITGYDKNGNIKYKYVNGKRIRQ